MPFLYRHLLARGDWRWPRRRKPQLHPPKALRPNARLQPAAGALKRASPDGETFPASLARPGLVDRARRWQAQATDRRNLRNFDLQIRGACAHDGGNGPRQDARAGRAAGRQGPANQTSRADGVAPASATLVRRSGTCARAIELLEPLGERARRLRALPQPAVPAGTTARPRA